MKKHLLIILGIFLSVAVIAQNNDRPPFLTKTFKSESFSATRVRTSGGGISVTGIDGGDARVEVYIQASNNEKLTKEEIQQRLDEKYDLEIAVGGNKLVATAKRKEKITTWKKGLSISFKVYVPVKTGTDLSTSGGSISLVNLSGMQEFVTSGGSLHVENVVGNMKGRTSGGSIHVKGCRENINLSTSGGSIDAENCEGKITLGTSGGSVKLKDLKGDVKVTTSGGNIDGDDIRGGLFASTSGGNIYFEDLACSLETSTSGGNIRVVINELGEYVKISSSGGKIELDIPKGKGVDLDLDANRVRTSRLDNFSGTMKEDGVIGKLNGGGIPVKVKARSGQIVLAFK